MKKADALLGPLIKQLGIEPEVRLARLRNSWDAIFSEPVLSHTFPATLSEGDLVINVDHPAYLQQFQFLSREILAKVGGFGVRTVRFRIGRVSRKRQDRADPLPPKTLSAEDREFVETLSARVKDPDLREAVRKSAMKSLESPAKKKKAGR